MTLQGQVTVFPPCLDEIVCDIQDTIFVYEDGVPIGMILTDSLPRSLTEMTVSGKRIFFAGIEDVSETANRAPRAFKLHWVVYKVNNHSLVQECQKSYFLGKYRDEWIAFYVYFKGEVFEIWAALDRRGVARRDWAPMERRGRVGMATTIYIYGEDEFDEFIKGFRQVVYTRPKLRPFSGMLIREGI